ncbi:iron ABC transporter permease [Corticibacter populi]|uniref:Iron ABC transporter permease n=1 Tax=Corticibacter populi TaxID=1550736 RepID=A0A3M6QZB0_9BURK|nr:iron ABC transporter permease [Corticibacter populi]RMX08253.1 iron ABC transporter permease [Corticibacter populi]RZS35528.1 iron complex transport system permease protein [Corticibacter populi]
MAWSSALGANSSPTRWRTAAWLLASALLATLALASLCIGSEWLSPRVVWQALWQFDPRNPHHLLLHHLRLPRTLLALLVGAALAVAGTLMQALSRNALAEPGILGVNAGAAAAIVLAMATLGVLHPGAMLAFGLAGAAAAGAAVYLLGGLRHGLEPTRLVLAGAALSVVLLAFTHLVTVNSTDEVFDHFRHWGSGALQGRGRDVLWPVAALIAAGLLLARVLAPALDAASLGAELGLALGSRTTLTWALAALAVVVLAGAATAAAGPIVFVGLTAPHLARAWGGHSHRRLLPLAAGLGALLVLAADVLGRLVARPGEVGVGIMVALVGAPLFIAQVRRGRFAQL